MNIVMNCQSWLHLSVLIAVCAASKDFDHLCFEYGLELDEDVINLDYNHVQSLMPHPDHVGSRGSHQEGFAY